MKKGTYVRLEEKTLSKLDELSRKWGVKRSELIREIIREWLRENGYLD